MKQTLIDHAQERVDFFKDLFHVASNPPQGEPIDEEARSWIVGGLTEAQNMVQFLKDWDKPRVKSHYRARKVKPTRLTCLYCKNFKEECTCNLTEAEREANTLHGAKPI